MLKLLSENIRLIIIALIAIILVIMIAIIISISHSDEVVRMPVISDISGEGFIYHEDRKIIANKKSKIRSGDIITTSADSFIRVYIDADKYITIEENSSVSLYYTNVSGKGTVEVSVTEGAVICQLDNPLKKDAFFNVKTPNSVVDVRGTVFRVGFEYAPKYMDYSNVYITEVQNFSGSVNIQLYDINSVPVDMPMLLMARTGAKMITAEGVSQYIYLNHDTDLYALSERTLLELLRICIKKELAYSTDEFNNAYKAVVRNKNNPTTETESIVTTENSVSSVQTIPSVTEITVSSSEPPSTTTSQTEAGTLATTRQTHVYTTYSGEKWWEIINPNPKENDDADYDDGGVMGNLDNAVTTAVPETFAETYFEPGSAPTAIY